MNRCVLITVLRIHAFIFLMLLGVGCGIDKHLQDSKPLYGGATIELENETKFIRPNNLKRDLLTTARPKANIKLKLWYHFNFGNPKKEKGTSNWIKRSFGEEPVFYNRGDINRSKLYLEKYLSDRGYFSSNITFDTTALNKEVIVNYTARSEGRYKIRDVKWPVDSVGVVGLLLANKRRSLIRSGEYYNVENMISERSRLNNIARNNGYYLFDESDIFYFVDTTAKSDTLLQNDIWLKVKEPVNTLKHRQFYIGETHVYPNFDLSQAENIRLNDTILYQDLTIYQNAITSSPRILRQSIAQKKGALYQVGREEVTLNHLLELGIFKFVNQKYKIENRADSSFLNRFIYLTPSLLQDYSGEVQMASRSGDFGLFLKGNYAHKNIFNGAERLDLSFGVGAQRGGKILVNDIIFSNNLLEFTGSGELIIPRFMVPFVNINGTSSTYTPKTKIGLSGTIQQRPDLFNLLNLKASFGYDWRETKYKRHELIPLNLNSVTFSNQTAGFLDAIEDDGRLQQSLSNILIPSLSYQFTYTNQELDRLQNYFFFRGKFETAGNIANGLNNLFGSRNGSDPFKFLGRAFSQFTRFDLDMRYNIQKERNQLVWRFAPSIAIPYGNSEFVPYTKQFFVGGPNSIRAFPNRSLLGSFNDLDEFGKRKEVAGTSFDRIGDLKLEMNLEYRFDLWKLFYMKGAFFVDAGNVWLLDNGDESALALQKAFQFNEFFSEISVGAGFGVRFDVQFLVLRLDYAIPIRKPFLDRGDRWTFARSNYFHNGWLAKNGSFNLGIGYPF